MNEAIKLAIEKGGWQPYELKKKATELMMVRNKGDYFRHQLGQDNSTANEAIELTSLWNKYVEDVAVLDPLFWQALGKALGWANIVNGHCGRNPDDFENTKNNCCWFGVQDCEWVVPAWQYYAEMYFTLVLTIRDTEKFWQDLLNPNRE